MFSLLEISKNIIYSSKDLPDHFIKSKMVRIKIDENDTFHFYRKTVPQFQNIVKMMISAFDRGSWFCFYNGSYNDATVLTHIFFLNEDDANMFLLTYGNLYEKI